MGAESIIRMWKVGLQVLRTQFARDLGCFRHSGRVTSYIYMRDGSVHLQVRDHKVSDLCPCVCVNASWVFLKRTVAIKCQNLSTTSP